MSAKRFSHTHPETFGISQQRSLLETQNGRIVGKRKARSIRPGLNILKRTQLNRGTRYDYELD